VELDNATACGGNADLQAGRQTGSESSLIVKQGLLYKPLCQHSVSPARAEAPCFHVPRAAPCRATAQGGGPCQVRLYMSSPVESYDDVKS